MNLHYATAHYRVIRDRVRKLAPALDEQILADTVEGLTDLHEIVQALADEALARGLKSRIAEMEGRLDRLQDRASKRRQIAKDVMVIDEAAVPKTYWEPGPPRLKRQDLAQDLKNGEEVAGATLSNPEPILTVRTK